jgi:hypothetical protein
VKNGALITIAIDKCFKLVKMVLKQLKGGITVGRKEKA